MKKIIRSKKTCRCDVEVSMFNWRSVDELQKPEEQKRAGGSALEIGTHASRREASAGVFERM